VFNDVEAQLAAESQIPSLQGSSYEPQSNRNPGYNCFAWAIRDSDHVVAPPGTASWARWSDKVPTWETLATYIQFYECEGGFERCVDGSLEQGYEKIALFTSENGDPLHAARQLPSGRWTSKLGKGIDVEHDLDTIDGQELVGSLAVFMKRPCPGPPPDPPGRVIIAAEIPELPPAPEG
jgi:hypothetical protein